jgi:hypothetical protein
MQGRSNSLSKKSSSSRPQYSVDLSMRGFSFGLGSRSKLLSAQGRDSPSPFQYVPVFNESPYKGPRLKGYSSDERIIKRLKSLPGPGSYNPYEPLGSAAPKYTIKSRLRNYHKSNTPGPNAYFPDHRKVLRNSPIYSMPSGKHHKDIKEKEPGNPGPGAYNLPKFI